MKTNFPNPIEPKQDKEIKSPWNFDCPPYDERSSCYVNAGSKYGVGHKQPVGHKDNPKGKVPALPYGRHPTMDVGYIHRGKTHEIETDADE